MMSAARAQEAARNVKPGLGQAADASDLVDVAEGVETEGRCHHQYELLAALLLPMLLLLLETLAEETIISIMSSCPPPCVRVQTPVLARQDTILG